MVRTLVEASTKRWVFRRRLPISVGGTAFYVTPSAGLKYLFKPMVAVDPNLLHCVHYIVNPGDVIWDVGANIGLFSFAAAARCGARGQVVAFEPDVWLVQILRRSSAIQPSTSAGVKVIPIAIASHASLRNFSIAKRARASNTLANYGHSQMGGIAEEQVVPTFNLDWLLSNLPAPNVLKIDVEGAEVEVLRNQPRMLKEVRPVIICEVAGQNRDKVTNILNAAKYVLYDGEQPLKNASKVLHAVWNTVAIPEEASYQFPRASFDG